MHNTYFILHTLCAIRLPAKLALFTQYDLLSLGRQWGQPNVDAQQAAWLTSRLKDTRLTAAQLVQQRTRVKKTFLTSPFSVYLLEAILLG